jgi:hypothetical protein
MPVLKVSTNIITCITAHPIRLAVLLVNISVSAFKTAIILYLAIVIDLIYAFSVATMKICVMSLSLPHDHHNIRSAHYILWQTIYPRSITIAKYRIMAVLKAETDIFTSSTASLIGWAVILVIMYDEIFKTYVFPFICMKHHNVTLHWSKFSIYY